MAEKIDYANLPTPPACVADFCLIPIGTPTASVSNEVAAVQRLMKASGLSYSMHSAGTTVEGSWDEVMRLIGQAHTLVHQNGVLRVQTDIRAGTRYPSFLPTSSRFHFLRPPTAIRVSVPNLESNILQQDRQEAALLRKGIKSREHPGSRQEGVKEILLDQNFRLNKPSNQMHRILYPISLIPLKKKFVSSDGSEFCLASCLQP